MAEKFRKEIRWVYNQRMPWLQIMTEARLQKVGRLGRDRASGRQASQIIYPQNWLVGDKCTIYEPTITDQSLFWENECATCEFALLVGGEGLLGLLLELLGSSRAGTVPLLRLQRPREALEQRAPCKTNTFTFFSFDSELICGARSTWCQVDQNYIFFKSFRLMAGIFISFVYLRIIPQYSRPKIRIFGLKLLRMSCVGTFFLFLISFRAGHFALLMGCLVPTSPHSFAILKWVVPLLEQNWQL